MSNHESLKSLRCVKCNTRENLTNFLIKKKNITKSTFSCSKVQFNTSMLSNTLPLCKQCIKEVQNWKKHINFAQIVISIGAIITVVSLLVLLNSSNVLLIPYGIITLILGVALWIYLQSIDSNIFKFKKANFYVKPENSSNWISYNEWLIYALTDR